MICQRCGAPLGADEKTLCGTCRHIIMPWAKRFEFDDVLFGNEGESSEA